MNLPNSFIKALGKVWSRIFDYWWDFYYNYGSCCPPLKHYMHDDRPDDWAIENYGSYDPICFPLPFKINCLGCMGCGNVKNPPLHPDIPKGPYKVFFSPLFIEQYEKMFGKRATFDLLWETQKQHMKIDKLKKQRDSQNS